MSKGVKVLSFDRLFHYILSSIKLNSHILVSSPNLNGGDTLLMIILIIITFKTAIRVPNFNNRTVLKLYFFKYNFHFFYV